MLRGMRHRMIEGCRHPDRSFQRWPSPARREAQENNLKGRSESAVAGQVHGRVRQAFSAESCLARYISRGNTPTHPIEPSWQDFHAPIRAADYSSGNTLCVAMDQPSQSLHRDEYDQHATVHN